MVIKNIRGTQVRVVPLPLLRNFQPFLGPANFTSLQRNLQPLRRVLCAESVFFPGERPIQPVRFFLGIRFFGKIIPIARRLAQFRNQEVLRRSLRYLSLRLRTGLRFRYFMFVTGDLSFRAHANLEFFFLLRLEKPHVPVPHVHFAGHQPVGLLQTNLPFQIRLRVIVNSKYDHRPVPINGLAQRLHEITSPRQRLFSRHLKIHRRFRKRLEKMPVRIPKAHNSGQHPQDQRTLLRPAQSHFRHPRLRSKRSRRTPNLFIRCPPAQVTVSPEPPSRYSDCSGIICLRPAFCRRAATCQTTSFRVLSNESALEVPTARNRVLD